MQCLHPHFGFVGYFTHDQICNPNRDYDLKYWQIYHFFQSKPIIYVYVTMTSQQRWYWAIDNNKISLLYSVLSCKIRSWSLRFRQLGVCQVNTTQSSKPVHSCLVNKWAKFGTKIFTHFRDIIIFVLEHIFRFTL